MKSIKITANLLLVILLLLSFNQLTFAQNSQSSTSDELLVISHRSGAGVSLSQIFSDFELGADMVSVNANEDGVTLLEDLYSSESVLIAEVLKQVPDGNLIIVDDCSNPDALFEDAKAAGAEDKILFRFSLNEKMTEWVTEIPMIDVYSGGVVFSAWKMTKTHENGIIQFQSKNYFNPFYQKAVTNGFPKHNVTVIAPMFDPDLCGQRTDGVDGWDEMLRRGYNAIETNNVNGLCNYKNELKEQRIKLQELISSTSSLVGRSELYSNASFSSFLKVFQSAKNDCSRLSALGTLQKDYSSLINAKNSLVAAGEKAETKGAWNITTGKVIASVLCAAVLVISEIFIIKKRKK